MLNIKKTLTKVLDYIGGLKFYDSTVQKWSKVQTRVLLWENASPTSSFAAQTIDLDLSEYDNIIMYTRASTSVGGSCFSEGKIGETAITAPISDGYIFSRRFTPTASGVVIMAGYLGQTSNNTCAIPLKIYGIKEV